MIEVGEYVRTKEGFIGKCIEVKEAYGEESVSYIFDKDINIDGENELFDFEENEFIAKKPSKNIIDLIEKDDYVNGCRVYKVEELGITVYQKVENSDVDYNWIKKEEIKTILTKEQYKANSYVV